MLLAMQTSLVKTIFSSRLGDKLLNGFFLPFTAEIY